MDVTPSTVVRTIPTLGRKLELGDLYNIRTGETGENPVKGETVKVDPIKSHRVEICHPCEHFQALKVSSDLRLEILLWPDAISGSSRVLLRYDDPSMEQILMIITYKAEQRSIDDSFGPDESGQFTHRIISAIYGTRIIILFEMPKSKKMKKAPKLIELVEKLNKIKTLDRIGLYRLDYREREMCKNVTCTVFSDVPIEPDVLTAADFVKLRNDLPTIIKNVDPVPLVVEISQLGHVMNLNADIPTSLANGICEFLSGAQRFSADFTELLNHKLMHSFPQISKKLLIYRELSAIFLKNVTDDIRQCLKDVKSGVADRQVLEQMMKKIQSSPFHMNVGYQDILQVWMNEQKELVNILDGIKNDKKLKVVLVGCDDNMDAVIEHKTKCKAVFYLGTSAEEKEHLLNMVKYAKSYFDVEILDAINDLMVYPGSSSSLNAKLRDFLALANSQVTYIVTENISTDSSSPGGQIKIYEDDQIVEDDFFILRRKLKSPEIKEAGHNSVVIDLNDNNASVEKFEVAVRKNYEFNFQNKTFPGSSETATIEGLTPGTLYEIKIRCLTRLGPSPYSHLSRIATGPSERPDKPEAMQISATGCVIQWSKPLSATASMNYSSRSSGLSWEVEIVWDGDKKLQTVAGEHFELHVHLEPKTSYQFRVRAIFKMSYQGTSYPSSSDFSEESEPFQLSATPLEIVKNRSVLNSKIVKKGLPTIRHLKLKNDFADPLRRLRRLSFGPANTSKPMKTILVVGATGAGKSTLINAFANYLLGIKFEDKHRFRIIEENFNADQSVSQTKWVTAYVLYHQETFPPELPYSLTIIDTPGFGDTQGIQADKEITDQLSEYFHSKGYEGIDSLDAVGFVVQASLPRLTPTQQYIFDSILALFGNDVKDNIFVLITFADGQRAPVLSALDKANIPYTRAFKFNNSALYADRSNSGKRQVDDEDSDDEQSFDQNFWMMGATNYKKFLVQLSKTQSKSLTLTNQVLDERHRLETHVAGIQNQIKIGLTKQDNLRSGLNCLQQHYTDIERNKDFEFDVTTTKIAAIPLPRGQYVTNCLTCNMTCHYPCFIPNDDGKDDCWAMDGGGKQNASCRICPSACHWSVHRNTPERLEVQNVTERQTVSKMKQEYEEACQQQLTTEELILTVIDEVEVQETCTAYLVEEVRGSLEKLSQIALRPNHMTTVGYIDTLIESEKHQALYGWQMRVRQLEAVRERAETTRKIAEYNGIREPWHELKKAIHEQQRNKGSWIDAIKNCITKMTLNMFRKPHSDKSD